MRHILPAKVDALSCSVSVMHREMTDQFGRMGERRLRIPRGVVACARRGG
jgi:hypothetical protein